MYSCNEKTKIPVNLSEINVKDIVTQSKTNKLLDSLKTKTIKFGKNNCGKIVIPSSWKIYDISENYYIEKVSGSLPSKKVTILRAADYDNSTFYVKLSTKLVDSLYSCSNLLKNRITFLKELNNDELQLINQLNSMKNIIVVKSTYPVYRELANACGGVFTYIYKNKDKKKKVYIYTLYNDFTFYNLTISWDVNKAKNPKKYLNLLLKNLKLCSL